MSIEPACCFIYTPPPLELMSTYYISQSHQYAPWRYSQNNRDKFHILEVLYLAYDARLKSHSAVRPLTGF